MFAVAMFPDMGRGLVATRMIGEGERVTVCELLVLSEKDTDLIQQTELKFYSFRFDEKRECLVLGDGELFNHAETANVGFRLVDRDGRKVMEFVALRPIEAGEQLFINYNADVAVDVAKYCENNSLVG